jgi:molybdopterin-guanine dinucleotide biosynthesis protein MobB
VVILTVPIILVAGFKNSGKTTLIENLSRDLVKKGFRIAVFKHVFHGDFIIDYEGKDTWRFIKAGAKGVVAVSRGRLFINEYLDDYPDLDKLLDDFKSRYDAIFLEGFKEILSSRPDIYKVIIGRNEDELPKLRKQFKGDILLELIVRNLSLLKNSKEYKELLEKILSLVGKTRI